MDFLHLGLQCPTLQQEWHVESFAGQCCRPGAWGLVQLPHCHFFRTFCMAFTVLVARPIDDMLSAMAMCVRHVANISAVVASIFMASSFLTRSVSLRARTSLNCMCCSFSASVGKLHLSASPRILSTSSSGVSPALTLISSSWYILHHCDTGWSMPSCRNFMNSVALFLVLSRIARVAPSGVHCSCFFHPTGPKKLSRYSNWVSSPSASLIPCSLYQLSIPFRKSRKSSYWSCEFQSNFGGFKASVGDTLIPFRALVKASMRAVCESPSSDMVNKCEKCGTVGEQSNRPLNVSNEEIGGTVEQHYNRPMCEIRGYC